MLSDEALAADAILASLSESFLAFFPCATPIFFSMSARLV